MKDRGEVYILVGEFDEYSARTLQFILSSFDKSHLETLRDELQKRADSIQEKYQLLLSATKPQDIHTDMLKNALDDLDIEARAISEKFNFRDRVEFTVEAVEFFNPEKESSANGD